MDNDIRTQEREYRRGLVLGFTLAEIMILVLFALLLVWMTGNKNLPARIGQLEKDVQRLTQEVRVLTGSTDAANTFDDLFIQLTAATQSADRAQQRAAALEEERNQVTAALEKAGLLPDPRASVGDAIAQGRERLIAASHMITAADEAASKNGFNDIQRNSFLLALPSLMGIYREAQRLGYTAQQLKELHEKTLHDLESTQGQLKNAQALLTRTGNGLEHPACWATLDGKPEYIFDVALRSDSIVVHNNALPNRADEQARLPLADLRFDVILPAAEFRQVTRLIYLHSERQECRFFVRVFDQTAPHEKTIYKAQLRTVGEHFYYYEELNQPWAHSD